MNLQRWGIFPLHKALHLPHVTAMQAPRHTAQTLSQMLTEAVQHSSGPYISIADLIAGIKTQALAILLIIFALPNILPALPGTSAITGLPLVLLTLQMAMGSGIWLPKIIAHRALPRPALVAMLEKSKPYFGKIERLLHPRLFWLTAPWAQRALGALMLVLSIIIMLPIPLANTMPALAIALMAIGLTERDGLFILAGLITAAAAMAVMIFVYWALISLALWQLAQWL